jgi:diaminohydroxyphosphoribosylaminopyrimidine deaminase/5-amino-6-(5-phosphoribosylamino)uracil reductase
MPSIEDRRWMARALELARRGLETTAPNPRVGCVLVRDGVVVGEGWHERAGLPHAEVNALRAAGANAQGAAAYVTLEPCSHHGRTPPCADALVKAGVRRVVVATGDPNPEVAGLGIARLRAAGIDVECGLLEAEARALNVGFFRRMELGLPFVRCKLAMSLDGRTAMASGESRWITAEPARADVQRLRARSCAVLTGIGTVLADDPRLDVRREDTAPPARQPLRVVLDSGLRIPAAARVLAPPGSVLIVTAAGRAAPRLVAEGAELLCLQAEDGRVPLRAVLQALAARGCNEVLIEAGATLAGAFARAGLIDEYVLYVAPVLMGSHARPLLDLPFERMDERRPLSIRDISAVGTDWRVTAVSRD